MSDDLKLENLTKQADFDKDTIAILTPTNRILRVYRDDKSFVTGWQLNVSGGPVLPGWAIKDLFGAIPLKEKTYRVTIEAMAPITVSVDVKASSMADAIDSATQQLVYNRLTVNTDFGDSHKLEIDPPTVMEL